MLVRNIAPARTIINWNLITIRSTASGLRLSRIKDLKWVVRRDKAALSRG
jgi:hypothetical protein